MQEDGEPVEDVEADLADLRAQDVPFAGHVLASMCTTPHPVAVEAYRRFLDTNLGDPWLNPGAAEVERRALRLVLDLVGGGPAAGALFLTGGSEANVTAMLLARERTGRRTILLPETAHFSFDKACRYLGMQPRWVPARPDGTADVDAARELVDDDVAAVVAIAGTTELGAVDDVPALAGLAHDHGANLHVDAALGGYVIPFARELGRDLPAHDLRVDGVTTLTVDPHKMGMAPSPAGILAVADRRHLDHVAVASPYVSTERQFSVQGTRSGAPAAGTYAVMRHLGLSGYRDVVVECLAIAREVHEGLHELGLDVVVEPQLNVVAFRFHDPERLREALRRRGFLVGRAPKVGGLKVVVMPHVTRATVKGFLVALEAALDEVPRGGGDADNTKAEVPPWGA